MFFVFPHLAAIIQNGPSSIKITREENICRHGMGADDPAAEKNEAGQGMEIVCIRGRGRGAMAEKGSGGGVTLE